MVYSMRCTGVGHLPEPRCVASCKVTQMYRFVGWFLQKCRDRQDVCESVSPGDGAGRGRSVAAGSLACKLLWSPGFLRRGSERILPGKAGSVSVGARLSCGSMSHLQPGDRAEYR